MEGHEMASQMRPRTTSTLKPDEMDAYYESNESSDASAQIESNNRVPPPKDFVGTSYTVIDMKKSDTDDGDGGYSSSNKIQDQATTEEGIPIIEHYGEYHRIPLTGPMVIKVRVDGTPVNDNQTLPEDEDLKQYQLTKSVYQNL